MDKEQRLSVGITSFVVQPVELGSVVGGAEVVGIEIGENLESEMRQ